MSKQYLTIGQLDMVDNRDLVIKKKDLLEAHHYGAFGKFIYAKHGGKGGKFDGQSLPDIKI